LPLTGEPMYKSKLAPMDERETQWREIKAVVSPGSLICIHENEDQLNTYIALTQKLLTKHSTTREMTVVIPS